MSVNTSQSLPRLLTRFALRHFLVMAIATMLIGWSAHSSSQEFHHQHLGTFNYSNIQNKYGIHSPIVFEQAGNPFEFTQHKVSHWWPGLSLHYQSFVWTNRDSPRRTVIDGVHYSVFELPGEPTIGYVIAVKDPKRPHWQAINKEVQDPVSLQYGRVLTFSSRQHGHPDGECCLASLAIKVTFIKLRDDPVFETFRTFTIPDFLNFQLFGETHGNWESPRVLSLSITLRNKNATCSMRSANTQHIKLPDLDLTKTSGFDSPGRTFHGRETVQFSFQCDSGISLFATLTDANSPGNRSTTLTNKGSAKGVGVHLYQTSHHFSSANCAQFNPCRYGPDSKAKNNPNQWQIGALAHAPAARNPSVSFKAAYVRTGDVKAGSVEARATITFSYQ